VQVFYLSVVYIYITVGDPVEVPLTGLSLSHCGPVPS